MITKSYNEVDKVEIRRKAENQFKKSSEGKNNYDSETDLKKLVQELQIHQIELELINEDLNNSRDEIESLNHQYIELYDFAPVGYFSLNNNCVITKVNINGSFLLGLDRSNLINRSFLEFLSNDSRLIFNEIFNEAFTKEKKVSCDISYSKFDNLKERKKYDSFAHIDAILSKNGEEINLVFSDTTKQKFAEESLIEAQRLSAIGEMASAVAHDFNNSLQTIFSNIELALINKDTPESIKKYLETVISVTSDAASRVESLQLFGSKKNTTDNFKPININEIINEVVNQSSLLWQNEAQKLGISIFVETKLGEVNNVLGNTSDLKLVLYNLLKNSIESMPLGGKICFESGNYSDKVFIRLTDNGIGMGDETKMRVFQPFFSTKKLNIGHGLGMSGAYGIIKEHKGKIFIKETNQGIGTTIEINLPFSSFKEIKDSEASISDNKSKLNLLWVDDDFMIREVATEILEILGHKGDIVESGKQALECLAKNKYDLVISDIGMPEMNGFQLAEIINNTYEGKQKIVFLTGWGSQITDDEKDKYGAYHILSKPISIVDIKKVLKAVVSS